MSRIGIDFIDRAYRDELFKKVEFKSEIQDMQYGHRLSKGDTYLIGENDGEKFYLTNYHDGSIEFWQRKVSRSGFCEETIVVLNRYESDCIYRLVESLYPIIFTEFNVNSKDEIAKNENNDARHKSENIIKLKPPFKWTDDEKIGFLRKRLLEKKSLNVISKEMGIRIGQAKGLQKYYKDGKLDHLVCQIED